MKAVIYYSWSGKTEQKAKAYAMEQGAELFAIKDQKRPGTLAAYTAGCFAAMRMQKKPIEPLDIPFERFDEITVMAPVWAGHPAPAALAALDELPAGKNVRVIMVSGGGKSSCRDKVAEIVRGKGCKFIDFQDIKG